MAKDQTATPGTHIPGPLYVESLDPAESAFTALPDSITDNSGGTASETIAVIGATYDQAEVANAVASLAAQINAILERIQ